MGGSLHLNPTAPDVLCHRHAFAVNADHSTVFRPAMCQTHVGGPPRVCSSLRRSPSPILTKARLPASTVASAAVSVLAFATSREERINQPAETHHDETQSYIVTQDIGVPHDAHNTVVSLTHRAPPHHPLPRDRCDRCDRCDRRPACACVPSREIPVATQQDDTRIHLYC